MKVGNRIFSGKGAREEAANALTHAVLTWRDDQTMQPRGFFRGFEILSKGKRSGLGVVRDDDRMPDLFIRGLATYSANLNAANPIGTVQSIEHTLRSLDKLGIDQQNRVSRLEKELADYQVQADRPFEHDERLKQLLIRQAELNSLLDLDKGDHQGAAPISDGDAIHLEQTGHRLSESRVKVAKMAVAYMQESGSAIRDLSISERRRPQTGHVAAKVVAADESHIALTTAPNIFFILELESLDREAQIGERLTLHFAQGQPSLDSGRKRAR